MLEFRETDFFTRAITQLLSDDEYAELQGELVVNPAVGDVIPGSGGLRNVRWNQERRGKGKRGGVRVIYYWLRDRLSRVHASGVLEAGARRSFLGAEEGARAACEGGVPMKKQLFDELVASVKQAGKIHRGEAQPSRTFVFQPDDVRKIREKLHKSQSEFARMIGVSVSTLQNWEQGRRQPEGPARALLVVASKAPEVVAKALAAAARRA